MQKPTRLLSPETGWGKTCFPALLVLALRARAGKQSRRNCIGRNPNETVSGPSSAPRRPRASRAPLRPRRPHDLHPQNHTSNEYHPDQNRRIGHHARPFHHHARLEHPDPRQDQPRYSCQVRRADESRGPVPAVGRLLGRGQAPSRGWIPSAAGGSRAWSDNLPADIRKGTRQDFITFAVGANTGHGFLRPTPTSAGPWNSRSQSCRT